MRAPTSLHRLKLLWVLVLLAAASGTAQASAPSGWDWSVAPYLWAVGVKTNIDTSALPAGVTDETKFDDIISKLDGAFQIHAEGQGDHFGMLADFTYLGLADENDRLLLHTESDLDTRLFELAGVWSPGAQRGRGFSLLGGARIIDLDYSTVFTPDNPAFAPVSVHIGKSFTDLMLGGRYTWSLSDRWSLTLRGDGSAGDTDGAWNVSATAQYRTRNGGWLIGYRYLDVDFKRSHADALSLGLHGLEVGYSFRF